jgi:predicted dehydrogenase
MEKSNQHGTTRREFVKRSTIAAVGAGLLGQFAQPAGAYAAGDDTIRVGLVGCGGRGTGAATQALSTEGGVKLVAMGDAFADQLDNSHQELKKKFDSERLAVDDDHKFVGFDAYQKVIDSGVDLVILATPPGFRPIHFEAAVNAGKHVFMEKPVAVDALGVRQVLEASKIAKEKNLKVGVGLQRRHQTCYLDAVQRLKEGAIGDILAFRVYWNGGGVWDPRKTREECSGEMEYQMRNWYYYNWLCGDHIVEQHIHNLDVANWIMDAYPVRCHGMGGRQVRTDPKYGEIFDHHAVEYEYAGGTRMFSQCRHIHSCWSSVSEHAIGSRGTADLRADNHYAKIASGGDEWRFRGERPDPYQVEHDNLFAAIRSDRPYNEADNGASSSMTAIMGRMATYSGKPIELEQALNSEVTIRPDAYAWNASPPTVPDENGVYAIAVPGVTKVV